MHVCAPCRLSFGRAYLAAHAFFLGLAGVALLALPASRTAGPSLAVVFRLAPRSAWGLVFLAAAAGCVTAAALPQLMRPAVVGLFALEVGWAIGLTAPLFLEREANVFAPIAWLLLASTSALVVAFARQRR